MLVIDNRNIPDVRIVLVKRRWKMRSSSFFEQSVLNVPLSIIFILPQAFMMFYVSDPAASFSCRQDKASSMPLIKVEKLICDKILMMGLDSCN